MFSPPPRAQCTATVQLLCGFDFESFISSVYANEVDIPSIQGFRISSAKISQSIGDAFADLIVKHLGVLKIRHLEIRHAEEFLGSSHRLVHAFARCTTITHLTLDEVGDRGRELLVKSRFSLVSADLTMPDLDDDLSESDSEQDSSSDSEDPESSDQRDPDYHARHNPIVLLRNSRRTLESLTGSSCKTLLRVTTPHTTKAKDLSFKHVYPRLTNLSLHHCAEVPAAFRLASAFPHLRTLHASCALDAIMDAGETAGGFRARRCANEGKQRVFGTWEGLEACRAPLLEHYLLGLSCRVERLHVEGDHMDSGMLGQVLKSTTPVRLSLSGFDADVFGPQAASGFADAVSDLPDDVVNRLEGLDVALDVGSTLHADHVDVEEMLANMTSTLQPLRIRSFSLSLAVSLHGRPRPPLDLVPLCPQERYLEGLDLDALATRIRTSVPSLRTVAIRLSGHPTRPDAAAMHEVVRDNAVPMVCDSDSPGV